MKTSTYKISDAEFISAFKLNGKNDWWRLSIGIAIFVIIMVGSRIADGQTPNRATPSVVFFLILMSLYVLMKRWSRKKAAKKLSNDLEMSSETSVWVSDDVINIKTAISQTGLPRNAIYKISSDDVVILIYREKNLFHIVPIRAVRDNDEVNEYLNSFKP